MSTENGEEVKVATATNEEVAAIWAEEVALREAPAGTVQPAPVVVVAENPEPKKEVPVTTPDATAGLPPEVRTKLEAYDKLAERMRNLEGHIGGLTNGQKQIRELLTASQEAAKRVAEAPTQQAVAAAAADPEKWSALKKDFPDWAGGVEALLDAKLAGVKAPTVDMQEIDRRVDARVPPALRKEIAEDILDATPEFEGWRDKIKTPEFVTWYEAQPDAVKVLAASDKFSDAAKMLRLYIKPAVADPAAAIQADRQRVLDEATGSPKGKRIPPAKSLDDMTAEEIWAAEAKKRDKARGL